MLPLERRTPLVPTGERREGVAGCLEALLEAANIGVLIEFQSYTHSYKLHNSNQGHLPRPAFIIHLIHY